MHLKTRNVNTAFATLVKGFHEGYIDQGLRGHTEPLPIVRNPPRYGEVLIIEEPVIVTYEKPLERVLFNAARDANPFFHLYESLWMLAGRNDVEPLTYYNSKMAEFSDDGKTFNGAYGYRWRSALKIDWFLESRKDDIEGYGEVDQLKIIIDQLKRKPESRRVVLQMWNVEDDLLKIDTSKDTCCNTCAYFSIRQEYESEGHEASEVPPHSYLDITVCNRSNDLIWGMLGANAVHFSFLQEYLAACIGVKVGVYNQITNNLHVYVERWTPEKWLEEYQPGGLRSDYWYGSNNYHTIPLVTNHETFDREIVEFVEWWSHPDVSKGPQCWSEPFLEHVAKPMCAAFYWRKQGDYSTAREWSSRIKADDWRIAAEAWISRREKCKSG